MAYMIGTQPIDINKIKIDPGYQRILEYPRAKAIAENFDETGFGLISVSLREDGFYHVVDGQHRFVAAKIMKMKSVPCLVRGGMTRKEESVMFQFLNAGKNADKTDKFKARIIAEDKKVLEIMKIIESHNLTLDLNKTGTGIKAIQAIEKIYDKGKETTLNQVLNIINNSFKGEKEAYTNFTLLGIFGFMEKFKGEYDEKWLIKRLHENGIIELVRKAKELKAPNGWTINRGMTEAIRFYYNKGRRNRLGE